MVDKLEIAKKLEGTVTFEDAYGKAAVSELGLIGNTGWTADNVFLSEQELYAAVAKKYVQKNDVKEPSFDTAPDIKLALDAWCTFFKKHGKFFHAFYFSNEIKLKN